MRLFVTLLITLLLMGCARDEVTVNLRAREDMRQFVERISRYAKGLDSDFFVIPQNGHELFTLNGEPDGERARDYLAAIDGAGQEDLYYGYDFDNEPTKQEDIDWLEGFLDVGVSEGVRVLVTNYCSDTTKMSDGYNRSNKKGYISYSADSRELDSISAFPKPIFHENSDNIRTLADAKNYLYLLNTEKFSSKEEYLSTLAATNYDLFIIDLYYQDEQLDSGDIARLKQKPNGGERVIISYMSIGEAEDYRYYWKSDWRVGSPSWIKSENPDWEGNYKIEYWNQDWQAIIYGNDNSYLKKILDANFDGVYLDIIDGYEAFEWND